MNIRGLKARLDKIEAAMPERPMHYVWRFECETTEQALKRAGIAPEDNFSVYAWLPIQE